MLKLCFFFKSLYPVLFPSGILFALLSFFHHHYPFSYSHATSGQISLESQFLSRKKLWHLMIPNCGWIKTLHILHICGDEHLQIQDYDQFWCKRLPLGVWPVASFFFSSQASSNFLVNPFPGSPWMLGENWWNQHWNHPIIPPSIPRSVSPDTWVNGKVARLAPFGAFVTVTAEGKSADGAWARGMFC